jgi:glycosyltransferase involved in cell wall biosynthesis
MKQLILLRGPILSNSGYGSRTRDIFKSLLTLEDKYTVRVIPCNWGQTQWLDRDNPFVSLVDTYIVDERNPLPAQPDLFINVDIPNHFQGYGKKNILISALVETNAVPPQWLEHANKYDVIIASSTFAKNVLLSSKYSVVDNNTQKQVGVTEFIKDIDVLFEGLDTDIYYKKDKVDTDLLTDVEENFCYLNVGMWMEAEMGEDRKNISGLIYTFIDTFKNIKNPPALVLKVNGGTYSLLDRDRVLERINNIKSNFVNHSIPNIYLLHGDLTDAEMNDLYNHPKIKAFVTLTKGEGFMRPLLEFSVTAKPIIASNYSGYLDFLNPEFITTLVPGVLTPVHPTSVVPGIIEKDTQWFTVNYPQAKKIMGDVHTNYKKYLEGAKRQAHLSKTTYNIANMSEKLSHIIDRYMPPKVEQFKLPQLKKIQLPTSK